MKASAAILALLAALWTSVLVHAAAPLPPGFEGLETELAGVVLQPVAADIPVLASPSATYVAARHAGVIRRAEQFFQARLGWAIDLRLVVLNEADWAKVTTVPYPAPHVWSRERMVVMPQSLSAFPGFGRWGFDDADLNAALTVHEIGHALIHRFAIPYDQMTHATDELLADVMLAALILDQMPEMTRLLDGAPAGFAPPGTRSLSDLDYFYERVGLETYAWHQFELARAAGYMARARAPGDLLPALAAALRGGRLDLPETLIGRLETVVPGVASAFAAFAAESQLPVVAPGPCQFPMGPGAGAAAWTLLAVENRSATAAGVRDHVTDKQYADYLRAEGKTPEFDPEDFAIPPTMVAPGTFQMFEILVGQDLSLEGGGCLRGQAAPVRHVIRD